MAPETSTARARLDDVETGLDAIEAALARLDAGEVDEDVVSPLVEAAAHVDEDSSWNEAEDALQDSPGDPDPTG